MPNKPDIIEYASENTPRPPIDVWRLTPFIASLCSVSAWLKSGQYHGYGQLPAEQIPTAFLVGASVLCLIITGARFARYKTGNKVVAVLIIVLCVLSVTFSAIALWNLHTAKGYRLF